MTFEIATAWPAGGRRDGGDDDDKDGEKDCNREEKEFRAHYPT